MNGKIKLKKIKGKGKNSKGKEKGIRKKLSAVGVPTLKVNAPMPKMDEKNSLKTMSRVFIGWLLVHRR